MGSLYFWRIAAAAVVKKRYRPAKKRKIKVTKPRGVCYTVICIASLFTAGAFFNNYRGNAPQEVPYGKDRPRAG